MYAGMSVILRQFLIATHVDKHITIMVTVVGHGSDNNREISAMISVNDALGCCY